MDPSYLVSGGLWLIATGVWLSLGGFAGLGFPGFLCYLGVCVVGGSLSGRYLSL